MTELKYYFAIKDRLFMMQKSKTKKRTATKETSIGHFRKMFMYM